MVNMDFYHKWLFVYKAVLALLTNYPPAKAADTSGAISLAGLNWSKKCTQKHSTSATTGVTNATGIYGGDAVEEMEIVPV
jgi:hypothetical protein